MLDDSKESVFVGKTCIESMLEESGIVAATKMGEFHCKGPALSL